jgi:hypothetical protein
MDQQGLYRVAMSYYTYVIERPLAVCYMFLSILKLLAFLFDVMSAVPIFLSRCC